MKDRISFLEAELDYADRMVRSGCATPAQAAQVCGVRLADLEERLAENPRGRQRPPGYAALLRN